MRRREKLLKMGNIIIFFYYPNGESDNGLIRVCGEPTYNPNGS